MNNENLGKTQSTYGIAEHNHRPAAWAFRVCRLLLGLVFVYASYDKILHPQAFAKAVFNYQLLPDAAVNLTALVLPWLELLLGLCLFFGILLPGAIVTVTGLMVVFLGALAFNQIRGLDIHCGCFSTDTEEGPAGLGTVLRDLAFLAISLYLFITEFVVRRRRRTMPIQIRR
ncbi:MAG: DoxX family protein [uncultured bacterium]|nr:MAG: DoxX family protein [uncultured bacterium]HBG18710.1 DoxX family protein [Desulfobulbaceae bacterium]